jgi:hypothetical protein
VYGQESTEKELESVRDHAEASAKEAVPADTAKKPAKEPKPEKQDKPKPVFAEGPRRFFEFGIDAGAGLANNFIGVGDILKQHIVLDLNKLGDKVRDDTGVSLDFDMALTPFFLNMNAGDHWGFGISTNVEGGIHVNLPKSLFTLISEGNLKNHSNGGDITAWGSVFADTRVDIHARISKLNKLKISIIPAMYVPLVYIPKSSIHYQLDADDDLSVSTSGEINVYSAFSLEDIGVDATSILNAKGFDISLEAEYPIFPILDVGATVTHIPLVAAVLNNRMNIVLPEFNINSSEILDTGTINTDFDLKREYESDVSYSVRRPLRFDFYAFYKPLKSNMLVLKPNIGFTLLTPAEKPYFNWGIDARLNLLHFYKSFDNAYLFSVHLGTGLEETLWKHRLGFALNLRAFELDVEAGLRSQEFADSFKLHGLNIAVGLRFGW